jgi:hypothetical protein
VRISVDITAAAEVEAVALAVAVVAVLVGLQSRHPNHRSKRNAPAPPMIAATIT